MFALWYGTIFYNQYKTTLLEKLRQKLPEKSERLDESTKAAITPSRIPVADPKSLRPTSPNLPRSSSPSTTIGTSTIGKPDPPKPQEFVKIAEPIKTVEPMKTTEHVRNPEPVKLEPPTKPPRSPSPHPLRAEAFEEIEYEDEEEEEEEASTDGEENSVISSSPRRNQLNSSPEQRYKN